MGELEVKVGSKLAAAGATIAFAESCTGGLVCSRVTDVPGSSEYTQGAVVVYSDSAKVHILGVSSSILAQYGTVSGQTAKEMARGARRLFSVDLGVGITGIAGPGGGTPAKPVGLVFIALSTPDGDWVEKYIWEGDRAANKMRSADAALNLVLRYLEGTLNARS